VTGTDDPADDGAAPDATATPDAGPLAYEPGDRLGVCLDIDGTVYRSGSVFVETLAFLPYADGISLSRADRRHRRTALTAVADYHGGPAGKAKWTGVLTAIDAIRVVGAEGLSESVLSALARRRTERSSRTDSASGGEGRSSAREGQSSADGPERSDGPARSGDGDYRAMSEAILRAYGAFLRGKRPADVEAAVAELVERRCPVESRLRETLDRLARREDADLLLVTDAPDHVATAYARKLGDAVDVVGTAYEVESGRYTGAFDRADKGETVARLRADRGWSYVVAAGDSPADAVMARDADLFLAVAGQSDDPRALPGIDAVALADSTAHLRERLTPARSAVRVPREEPFERALRTALGAVGVDLGGEG
jgi:phosphoserine phosphatase